MNRCWPTAIVIAMAFCLTAVADDAKKGTGDKDAILKRFAEEFVSLTPGKDKFPATFVMGSDATDAEKPSHKVTLKSPFAINRYEVTQELYEAVMGNNPSKWKGPRNSVEMTTWDDAVEFCKKVTTELRTRKLLGDDEVIRLPSEAEWEYACRAGTTTAFSFGDKVEDLSDYAWFRGNSKGYDPPVGAKKANPWGLYDMHGYLWEWCQDNWQPTYEKAPTDGSAVEIKKDTSRVLRSGSWADEADTCRSAYRMKKAADFKDDRIGFRCVKSK
jgi:formylglycine-generating enzyme required for sulfatase activity